MRAMLHGRNRRRWNRLQIINPMNASTMRFPAVLAVCLLTSTSPADELRILAWNVESDGNDPNVIVRQLHDLSGYFIVGPTEVKASSIKKYVDALSASGNTFLSVNTATGRSDRIVLAYNTRRLQLLIVTTNLPFENWTEVPEDKDRMRDEGTN